MGLDILPSSVPKALSRTFRAGVPWVAISCANCGCDGGLVPEESIADGTGFAFYLCDPCAEKWSPLVDTMLMPDQVFWQKVHEAQLEKYGRILSPQEQVDSLKDVNSILSKLARERRDHR